MNKFEKYKDILFTTLAEITSLIIAGNDKQLIFERLLDCSLTVLEAERVYLLEIVGNDIIKYSKSKDSDSEHGIRVNAVKEAPAIRHWIIKEGKETGDFARGEELALDLSSLASEYIDDVGQGRLILSAPLVAKKAMFGLLVAIHPADGGMYAPEDVKLVTVLANQAAIALENRQLYQKLEKEAITDGLTSAYNYRFLISSLATEIKRARRFGQVFSFIMLDVDNLKEYNDRLGHLSGSQALRDIAQLIRASCRDIDLVCKYGGDEFGILLPQTDSTGAETVARRVIEAVASHKFDGTTSGVLTCSAGISTFPNDGPTGREIIASADKALYEAKRTGKNKLLTTRDLVAHARR
jgi:diguanylate cyclase (GGDEF)-like protein